MFGLLNFGGGSLVGEKCRGRKTWRMCVNDDMKLHGLQPEWAVFRDV